MSLLDLKSNLSAYRFKPTEPDVKSNSTGASNVADINNSTTPLSDRYLNNLRNINPIVANSIEEQMTKSPLAHTIKEIPPSQILTNSVSKLSPTQIGKTEKGKLPIEKLVSIYNEKIGNKKEEASIEKTQNVISIHKKSASTDKKGITIKSFVDNKTTIHKKSDISLLPPTPITIQPTKELKITKNTTPLSSLASDFDAINKRLSLTTNKQGITLGKKIEGRPLTSDVKITTFENVGVMPSPVSIRRVNLVVIDSQLGKITPLSKIKKGIDISGLVSKLMPDGKLPSPTNNLETKFSKYGFTVPTGVDFFSNTFATGFNIKATTTSFTGKQSLHSWSGRKENAPEVDFFDNKYAVGFKKLATQYVTNYVPNSSKFSFLKPTGVNYFDEGRAYTVKPFVLYLPIGSTNLKASSSGFVWVGDGTKGPAVDFFDVAKIYTTAGFTKFAQQYVTYYNANSTRFAWKGKSADGPADDFFDVIKRYTTAGFHKFAKIYDSKYIKDASEFDWDGSSGNGPAVDFFDISKHYTTAGFHKFARIYDTKYLTESSEFVWKGNSSKGPLVDFFDRTKLYQTAGFHRFAQIYDTKYIPDASIFDFDGHSVDAPTVDFFDISKQYQTAGFHKFAQIYDTKYIKDASIFDFDGHSVDAPTVDFFDITKRYTSAGFHKFAKIYDTKYIPDASIFDFDGTSANAPEVDFFDVVKRYQTKGFHKFAQIYDTKYIKDASIFDWDGRSVDAPEVDFFDRTKLYQTKGFHKFAQIFDTKYIPEASIFDWDGHRPDAPSVDFFDISKRYQTKGFHTFAQIYDTKYIPEASIFDWDGHRLDAPAVDFFDITKRYQTVGFHTFAQIYDTKYIPEASIFDWDGHRPDAPSVDFFDISKQYQTKGFHTFAEIYDTKYIPDASIFDWDGRPTDAPETDFFDITKRYATKGFEKFAKIYDTKYIRDASIFDWGGKPTSAPETDFFDTSKRFAIKGFERFAKVYDSKYIRDASIFGWKGTRDSAPAVDYIDNRFANGFTTFSTIYKTQFTPDASSFVWKGTPAEVNFIADTYGKGFVAHAPLFETLLKTDASKFSFAGKPLGVDFFTDPDIKGFTVNQQLTNLDTKQSKYSFSGTRPFPVNFFDDTQVSGFTIEQKNTLYKQNSKFGWKGTSYQAPSVDFIFDSAASGFVTRMDATQYKGISGEPIVNKFYYPQEVMANRLFQNKLVSYNRGFETLITRDFAGYDNGKSFNIENSLVARYIATNSFDFRMNHSPLNHYYFDDNGSLYPLIYDIYGAYRRLPSIGFGYDRLKDWLNRGKERSTRFDVSANDIGPDKILQYFYKGIQDPDYKGILKKYADAHFLPGLKGDFQYDMLRWDIAKGTMDVATMNAETLRRYNSTLRRLDQADESNNEISQPWNANYTAEQFDKMVEIAAQDTSYDNKLWQSAKVLGTPLLSESTRGFSIYEDVQTALDQRTPSDMASYRSRVEALGILGLKDPGKIGNRLVDLTAEMIPSPTTLIPFNLFGLSSSKIADLSLGGIIQEAGSRFGGNTFSTSANIYSKSKLLFGKELNGLENKFGITTRLGEVVPTQYDVGNIIKRITRGDYEFHRAVRTTPDDTGRWMNYTVDKQYEVSKGNVDQDQGESTRTQSNTLGLLRSYLDETPGFENLSSVYVAFTSTASTTPDPDDPFSSLKPSIPPGTSDVKFKKNEQHTVYNPFFDKADGAAVSGPGGPNRIFLDDLRRKGLMRTTFLDVKKQYAPKAKRAVVTIYEADRSTAAGALNSEPVTGYPVKTSPMKLLYQAFLKAKMTGDSDTVFGNGENPNELPLDVNYRTDPTINLNPFARELQDGLNTDPALSLKDKQKQFRTMAYGDIPDIANVDVNGVNSKDAQSIHYKNGKSMPILDFRDFVKNPSNKKFSTDPRYIQYGKNNLEARYGIPDAGRPGVDKRNPILTNIKYTQTDILNDLGKIPKDSPSLARTSKPTGKIVNDKPLEFRGDRINIIDYKKVNAAINRKLVYEKADYPTGEYNSFPGSDDLIDFYFTSLILKGHDYCPAEVIVFRAVLGSITDTFSPSWNSQKYIGRADPVYIYSSFERDLKFDFKVYINSRDELKATWRKLNYLASWTAPDYTRAGTMRGPVSRVTIGNIHQKTPGFISSLSYTYDNGETTWETAGTAADLLKSGDTILDNLSKPGALQLPKLINVSVGFTVISNYRPQKNGIMFPLYDDSVQGGVETGLMPTDPNKVNYFRVFDDGTPNDWKAIFPPGYEYKENTVAGATVGQSKTIKTADPTTESKTNNNFNGDASNAVIQGNNPPTATIPILSEPDPPAMQSPINTGATTLNEIKTNPASDAVTTVFS